MAILHTHRRNLILLERARVHLSEGRTVHAEAEADEPISRSWNIPSLNCSAVILGQGCSITQPAVRKLSDDGVLLGFAGTGGTPFLCASQSYRPSEALQTWITKWPNAGWRFQAAKYLQHARINAIRKSWVPSASNGFIGDATKAIVSYENGLDRAKDVQEMTGFEGACTKSLYSEAAKATGVYWTGRIHQDAADRPNRFLTQGNYLAYGLAGIALWVRGIPPSLPVVHGRSNGGGLVFDLADTIKDAIILPTAFQCAVDPLIEAQAARHMIVANLYDATHLDKNGAIGFLLSVLDELIALPCKATGLAVGQLA